MINTIEDCFRLFRDTKMKFGLGKCKKQLIDFCLQQLSNVKIEAIEKTLIQCTVNNAERFYLGAVADLFYYRKRENCFYPYTEETKNVKYFKGYQGNERVVDFINKHKQMHDTVDHYKAQKHKTLLISSCTKGKLATSMEAYKLYQGLLHTNIVDIENKDFDWYIISGGYGVIPADTIIETYGFEYATKDCHNIPGLTIFKKSEIHKLAQELNMIKDLQYVLDNSTYENIIILLPENYYYILDLTKLDTKNANILMFETKTMKELGIVEKLSNAVGLTSELAHTSIFGSSIISLKTKILKLYYETNSKYTQDSFLTWYYNCLKDPTICQKKSKLEKTKPIVSKIKRKGLFNLKET